MADFIRPDGIGHVLQKRLQERAASRPNTSWLQEWWNDLAYLSYRDSIVYNVTYYLQFADELPFAMADPSRRAARFVSHGLKFRDLVASGQLAPDMQKGGKPMSNTQWKYVFNCCRMPGDGTDFVRTYAPDLHNHIVVARKNRFYSFDVYDLNGDALSVDALELQFKRIIQMADAKGTDPNPIGILTAENRDVWYQKRKLLLVGPKAAENEKVLELIQSSIFAVTFDDSKPVTREEVGRALLHGDGKNKFWDKSFMITVFDNGKMGYVGEHAMADGLTTTRFVNETLDKMFSDPESKDMRTSKPLPVVTPGLTEPVSLQLTLTKEAKSAIKEAEVTFDEIISTKELSVLMFYGYGSQQIKKYKTSPDAFAQLAIQLAYYKTFGYCRGTYESTQTRAFLHGRTEVTRSVNVDSDAFCKAMTTGALSHTSKQLHQLLVKATQTHVAYIGQASRAQGCDRHLLGLKLLLREGEHAAIFDDAAYKRSGHWAISTSGLVGENMDGWGFGEVVPDGIGIGYSVQNNRIRYSVTSRHKWAKRMTANLERALLEMQALCEANTEQPRAKL
uniref:Choline/carnitine acyltransferase domain-containing protein n=1 Tax=Aplanochytrium stocchinoi TaxID=215587 RepID=A0A7S3LJ93_9STRA